MTLPRTIPWLTEQAIAFLDIYLSSTPNPRVLEFGCGGSTVWLQSRVEQLVSVHEKGVTYREETDAWVATLPLRRAKGKPSNEIDLLKAYIDTSERASTVFVDDDYPSQEFTGLTAYETHLTTATPGRLTSKVTGWL